MNINITFTTTEHFLPTKRHKVSRIHYKEDTATVSITEVSKNEFPVAFIIHDMQSVYENVKHYDDFNGKGDFRMFDEEIRTFNGRLYKPVRVTHGAAISTVFEPISYLNSVLRPYRSFSFGKEEAPMTETAIITESDREEKVKEMTEKAKNYIICENVIWKTCGEPMYNITTFGLGHNHGGTGFFIEYSYNSNINAKNYFNALQREEAIKYGKEVALNRGDTDSVEDIGKFDNIEVLMPEMVKRNPKIEHGEGDKFINSIEEMISATDNSTEAGLLAIAMCAKGSL